MFKYRVLLNEKERLGTNSLYKAVLHIKERYNSYPDNSFILEENNDGKWEEWLDNDDQNVYEYLYHHNDDLSHLVDDVLEEEEKDITEFMEDDEKKDGEGFLSDNFEEEESLKTLPKYRDDY